jgi:hypothetical protein
MASIPNPYQAASPIGQAISNLGSAIFSGPSPIEQEQMRLQGDLMRAQTGGANAKARQAEAQHQAQTGIASLIGQVPAMRAATAAPVADPGVAGPARAQAATAADGVRTDARQYISDLPNQLAAQGAAFVDSPKSLGDLFLFSAANDPNYTDNDVIRAQAGQGGTIGVNDAVSLGGQDRLRAANQANDMALQDAKPASPTASIQEYEFARSQGYAGTFQDFKLERARAGASQVNVGQSAYGTIPQGYQLVKDEAGALSMSPIPGGPAAAEAAAVAAKADAAQQQREVYADIVTTDADRIADAISSAHLPTTGLGGSLLSNMPSTAAHNISTMLGTIRSNIGFDRLQEMRSNSPTGGALGPVSDFENKLLQATMGSLEQSQTRDQFLFNLNRVKQIYSKIINEGIQPGDPITNEAAAGAPAAPNSPPGNAPAEVGAVPPPPPGFEVIQ